MPETRMVKLSDIILDDRTQLRFALSADLIKNLAIAEENGEEVLAIDLFTEDDKKFWIGDGHHRVAGRRKAQKKDILAIIHRGDLREAILFAAGCNAQHDKSGLRRSDEDKRKAVDTLLKDSEWVEFTDHVIARRCGVSHSFVGDRRKIASAGAGSNSQTGSKSSTKSRTGRDGKNYPQNPPQTEREPGLEDDELDTDKVGKNSENQTKNGAEVFDALRVWRAIFGPVVRFRDDFARAFPQEKNTGDYFAFTRLTGELEKTVERWRKKAVADQKRSNR